MKFNVTQQEFVTANLLREINQSTMMLLVVYCIPKAIVHSCSCSYVIRY
jgi:hypothetical protein